MIYPIKTFPFTLAVLVLNNVVGNLHSHYSNLFINFQIIYNVYLDFVANDPRSVKI